MKGFLRFAALPLAIALPLAAQAADGFISANITLRAGPALEYPELDTLPYGTYVSVQGCTEGWQWCDVIANGDRGWVAGDYIAYEYEDQPVLLPDYGPRIGIPIVTFVIGSYWPEHYRTRSFFRDRDNWYHRDFARAAPPPPPRPSGGWRAPPPPPGGWHHGGNPPRATVSASQHPSSPAASRYRMNAPKPSPQVRINQPRSATVTAPHVMPHPKAAPRPAMMHAPQTHAAQHVSQPMHGPANAPMHTVAAPRPALNANRGTHPQPKPASGKKKDNNANGDNGH